jgi:hypothetical protein
MFGDPKAWATRLMDEGSPSHTSPAGIPTNWCGLGVLCGLSDAGHVLGEDSLDTSWSGVGTSLRNMITAFVDAFLGDDISAGARGDLIEGWQNAAVDTLIDNCYKEHWSVLANPLGGSSPGEVAVREDMDRQCAYGNPAACQ